MIAFTLALALAAPAAADLLPPAIELPAEATTPGTRILLRDLVADALERDIAPAMLDLDLGRAPSPGFGRAFDRRLLESLAPSLRFSGNGAQVTTVRAEVATIPQSDLEDAARGALERAGLAAQGAELQLVRAP